ncbi:hypothetical protein C7M84_025507 [Penaeus vannamei]|uniref:Uncharacterized protein n=1 Tax=Penaeus vannamei TaxID=6689 RepID=A0A423TXZ8_PENVA|nr:hypothetical protein C7M84_025507 [Penaeus vannamei]
MPTLSTSQPGASATHHITSPPYPPSYSRTNPPYTTSLSLQQPIITKLTIPTKTTTSQYPAYRQRITHTNYNLLPTHPLRPADCKTQTYPPSPRRSAPPQSNYPTDTQDQHQTTTKPHGPQHKRYLDPPLSLPPLIDPYLLKSRERPSEHPTASDLILPRWTPIPLRAHEPTPAQATAITRETEISTLRLIIVSKANAGGGGSPEQIQSGTRREKRGGGKQQLPEKDRTEHRRNKNREKATNTQHRPPSNDINPHTAHHRTTNEQPAQRTNKQQTAHTTRDHGAQKMRREHSQGNHPHKHQTTIAHPTQAKHTGKEEKRRGNDKKGERGAQEPNKTLTHTKDSRTKIEKNREGIQEFPFSRRGLRVNILLKVVAWDLLSA